MKEIIFDSATSLAASIRDRRISSTELTQAYLDRIEKVNPDLNAVVMLDETAMDQARAADDALAKGSEVGPLHGVPITLKDSHDTAGIVTTGGTLGRANFVPDSDSTVTARLRAAGVVLLGKTNTPELTMGMETENLVYGRTNNPYDTGRTCGGSSGGGAAIVAAGGSAFDIGTDTGGSIRFPGHCCGVAGIKPTSGRVPRTGHIIPYGMGIRDSLTQVGPIARYVEDLALVLPVISGPDWRDPAIVPMPLEDPSCVDASRLRVAFYTDNGVKTPTPETVDAVTAAASALADAGGTVVEDRPGGPHGLRNILEESAALRWFGTEAARRGRHHRAPPLDPQRTGILAVGDGSGARGAHGGGGRIPKRHPRVHGGLRPSAVAHHAHAGTGPRRHPHEPPPIRFLHSAPQPHRMAHGSRAGRHIARGTADWHSDCRSALA